MLKLCVNTVQNIVRVVVKTAENLWANIAAFPRQVLARMTTVCKSSDFYPVFPSVFRVFFHGQNPVFKSVNYEFIPTIHTPNKNKYILKEYSVINRSLL